MPLGDVSARLNFLPLFLGRARLSLGRRRAQGPVSKGRSPVAATASASTMSPAVCARRPCSRRCRLARSTSTTSAPASTSGRCTRARAGSAPPSPARSPGSSCARASPATPAAPTTRCSCRWSASRAWSSSTSALSADGRYRLDLIVRPGDAAAVRAADRGRLPRRRAGLCAADRRRVLILRQGPIRRKSGSASFLRHTALRCGRGGFPRRP